MNIWGLGSGGGEQLAGLRLGLLDSISGALGICSRGQQKGLFSFGSPIPGERVKVTAVM